MLIVNNKHASLHKLFINEDICNEATSSKLREDLKNAYLSKLIPGYKFVSNFKPSEVLRASLGKDDNEFLSNVKMLLSEVSIDETYYEAEVTRDSSISGKFNVVKIILLKPISKYKLSAGDTIFITNQSVTVPDKHLSPQGLGIVGNFTKSKLIKAIQTGLDNSKNIDENLKNSLIYIINKINNNTAKDVIDLDDMIINGTKKILTYDLPKSVNLDLFTKSLNIIIKDFGEIIGGIFLLNYLDEAKSVRYDESVTTPMIDYEVVFNNGDVLGISAKAQSGGHPPAASRAFKSLQSYVTSGEEINGLTFNEFVAEHVKSKKAGTSAKRLFELMTSLSGAPVREQYISLINEYCSGKTSVKKFCKLFGLKSFNDLLAISDAGFAEMFDSVCHDSKKFNSLLELFDLIKSDTGHSAKSTPTTKDEALALNKQKKIGIFVYPLVYNVVDHINGTFGLDDEGLDIISAFIRLAFSHKQIYLGIKLNTSNNSVILTFSFTAMNTGKWKFKCVTSANEPWKQTLGITMVH